MASASCAYIYTCIYGSIQWSDAIPVWRPIRATWTPAPAFVKLWLWSRGSCSPAAMCQFPALAEPPAHLHYSSKSVLILDWKPTRFVQFLAAICGWRPHCNRKHFNGFLVLLTNGRTHRQSTVASAYLVRFCESVGIEVFNEWYNATSVHLSKFISRNCKCAAQLVSINQLINYHFI